MKKNENDFSTFEALCKHTSKCIKMIKLSKSIKILK